MSFTGKATYSAGSTLPELVEDIADLVGIVSPYETPLLNLLGDSSRPAINTYHQWMEDSLLPNKDTISDTSIGSPNEEAVFGVAHIDRFQIGDQIQVDCSGELMLVTGISGNELTVERGYAGTPHEDIGDEMEITILGNAALEGGEKPKARFTNRVRKGNYTQIFTSAVEVSGSDIAARQYGIADELDYQKQERLRELLRDLENTVINGGLSTVSPEGTSDVRRTMNGIIPQLISNSYRTGVGDISSEAELDETLLNDIMRRVWERSNGRVDTIVVNGNQKRMINHFIADGRQYGATDDTFSNMVNFYESDFGICRIVVSRWMPRDAVLFMDSSRVSVLPMVHRSFHYKPIAPTGDYECGQLIGEYTLELKNEEAHGILRGLPC